MLNFFDRSTVQRALASTIALAAVGCTTPADIAAEERVREEALHCATDPSSELTAPNAFNLAANGAQIYVCQANPDGSTRWVIQAEVGGAPEQTHLASVAQGARVETRDGLMPQGTCTAGATARVEYTTLHASFDSKRKR